MTVSLSKTKLFVGLRRDRPYFSKSQKIVLQNVGLITFLKKFYLPFLLYYFLRLDKFNNNQNQEGFIICQK